MDLLLLRGRCGSGIFHQNILHIRR
jgi:hypothetical protein